MGIREDFQAYTNAKGFVTNAPGPNASSGNDLLFTAEAREVMISAGAWKVEDQSSLMRAITVNAQLAPGLYQRPGWAQDQEAQDDYVGLALIDLGIAEAIHDYGLLHFWYFKTSLAAKWWEPIFWRWPALIAHVAWCRGRKPLPWFRLAWAIAVAFGPKAGDLDSFKLAWLLILAVRCEFGWLEAWAMKRFNRELRAAYPGGMKEVYEHYFGATHPIAVYCPGTW